MNRTISLVLALLVCLSTIAQQTRNDDIISKAELFHQEALEEHKDGRNRNAYIYTTKSISILDSIGEKEIPLYAECKHDAGMFALMGLNDSIKFSANMQEAIDLKKQLYGYSEDYYWSIECYADGLIYLADSARFPKMLPLLEKAICLYEKVPNYESSASYRRALNNLSFYYEEVDIEKSIELAERLLVIQKNNEVGDTLITLSNLAKYYIDIDNERALSYAQEVLEVRERLFPDDYKRIKSSHYVIASIYGHSGNYEKAIFHSERARELDKSIYGEKSWQYALSTQNMGVYYMMNRDTINSLKFLNEAYSIPNSNKMGCAINLAGIYRSKNEVDSCYKYVNEAWTLFCPSFISDLCEMSERNRFNYACANERYHIMTLPVSYFTQHKDNDNFKRLAYDCMLFCKNVGIDCMDNEKLKNETLNSNFRIIKSYLGDNDVAIDFWSFKNDILINEEDYIVSVVKNSYDAPLLITLSKEKINKSLRNEYETTSTFLPLYENIWKEIINGAEIKEGDNLYISLDDELCNIPIDYICDYDGEYVGDKYNISYVSSMREITKINDTFNSINASLYGGLAYDCLPDGDSGKKTSQSDESHNIYNELGDTIVSTIRSFTNYLPWTKIETDSIENVLSSNKNEIRIEKYQGETGTEDNFKSLSGKSPSVLHISTHGFNISLPDEDMTWYDYYIYCMEHTGLLFSGALVSQGKDEDGFLRSTEIAPLKLNNTELLVLSACKTGIGGQTPIGNAGLQRAFKAAGVGTILMTLSDVDDAATCTMMVAFYKYLVKGLSKREAFKKAQLLLRESGTFNSFDCWANFRLID